MTELSFEARIRRALLTELADATRAIADSTMEAAVNPDLDLPRDVLMGIGAAFGAYADTLRELAQPRSKIIKPGGKLDA